MAGQSKIDDGITTDRKALQSLKTTGRIGVVVAIVFAVQLLFSMYIQVTNALMRFNLVENTWLFHDSIIHAATRTWLYTGMLVLCGVVMVIMAWRLTDFAIAGRGLSIPLAMLALALAILSLAAMVSNLIINSGGTPETLEPQDVYLRILFSQLSFVTSHISKLICLLLILSLLSGISRHLNALNAGKLVGIATWIMLPFVAYTAVIDLLGITNILLKLSLGHYFQPLQQILYSGFVTLFTILMSLPGIAMAIVMMLACRRIIDRAGSLLQPTPGEQRPDPGMDRGAE